MKTKFPSLLRNGLLAILACVILVLLAYHYIDKPVAYWMYQHHIADYSLLKSLTHIADIFLLIAFLVYVVFLIRFSYGLNTRLDNAMLAMANSIAIASFIKTLLKAFFGRYWPQTWVCNNLSLLQNNKYGFHFFHGGFKNDAFPSGHTTVIVAAMVSLWFLYPKFRWIYAILMILVMAGLIGMNYHFVGDVIGGTLVGALTAYYVVKISQKT